MKEKGKPYTVVGMEEAIQKVTEKRFQCEIVINNIYQILVQAECTVAGADWIKQHKGYCIISSYENELYDTVLDGWTKIRKQVQTNCAHTATECLYINHVSKMDINLFM